MNTSPEPLRLVDTSTGAAIATIMNKAASAYCDLYPQTSSTDVWLAGLIYTAEISISAGIEFDDIWASFAQIYERAKRNKQEREG